MDKLIFQQTFQFALRVLTIRRDLCDDKNFPFLYEEWGYHGLRVGAEASRCKGAEEISDYVECFTKTLSELRTSMRYFEKIYAAKDVTEAEYVEIHKLAEDLEKLILDFKKSVNAIEPDQPKSSI
jgi:hypothetical protein